MMFPTATISLSLAFCCLSCGMPDRNVTRKLASSDVVGTWRMTAEARKLLERDGSRQPTTAPAPATAFILTIRADGTFDADSLYEGDGPSPFRGSGTWQLLHDVNKPGSGYAANVVDLTATGPAPAYCRFHFAEDRGPLRLWTFYGDPDTWEFIEYERTTPPPPND